jgi:citrate synthase
MVTLNEYRRAGYLLAAETAQRLGIKQATLYAYVSRGQLQAHRASDARVSLFHPDEVERLRARPARAARPELSIPSAVTLIRPDGLYYRGMDAISLAATHNYEHVAELLWHGPAGSSHTWQAPAAATEAGIAAHQALPPDALPIERLQAAIALMATADPLRYDVTAAAVLRVAPGLITAMAACVGTSAQMPDSPRGQPSQPLADTLSARLSARAPSARLTGVVNAAMILLADHELAASTVAVRIAAAARSPVYGCIAAGLGVLQGPWHGGMSLRAEDLLAQIRSPEQADAIIRAHLSRGDPLWGFGHPLYTNGDPRAAALLHLILSSAPARQRTTISRILAFTAENSLPPPNIDIALAALAYCWSLRRGAGQAIFAVARTAGWIAHAIEEYERKASYRIRATYTGPPTQDRPRDDEQA